jgi:hypothetical protein
MQILDPAIYLGRGSNSPACRIEEIELKVSRPLSVRQEGDIPAIRRVLGQAISVRTERQYRRLAGSECDLTNTARRRARECVHKDAGKRSVFTIR